MFTDILPQLPFSPEFLLVGVLFLLGFILCVTRVFSSCQNPRPTYTSNLESIYQILQPDSNTPLSLLLESRALPNSRLIRCFGLSNTFVSREADTHAAFVKEAKSLIDCAGQRNLPLLADEVVYSFLTVTAERDKSISFLLATQVITLMMILTTLFSVDTESLARDDLAFVATGINILWQRSKVSSESQEDLLEGINSRLRSWLPDQPNPLNFIIPTYETMWRVVAVTISYCLRDVQAKRVLDGFLDNPTHSQFIDGTGEGISAESLIKESLRLHPPTRRISRVHPRFDVPFFRRFLSITAIANIGELHRNQDIWGSDANVYNPSRFHSQEQHSAANNCTEVDIRLVQDKALLPFGYGRLKCIASTWAPRFAAVIVATILSKEGDEFLIVPGPMENVGARDGWEGWKFVINH